MLPHLTTFFYEKSFWVVALHYIEVLVNPLNVVKGVTFGGIYTVQRSRRPPRSFGAENKVVAA